MNTARLLLTGILFFILYALPAHGQETGHGAKDSGRQQQSGTGKEIPPEKPVVTTHSISKGGKPLRYTATAGYMQVGGRDNEQKADIFFVAYVKDSPEDRSKRPITFIFNGGPGASSVWLHLGAIGPKRIAREYAGKPLLPPYTLVDNEHTWLDLTDLVFIDPVGTGYSRAASKENEEKFYGTRKDIQSVGEFIRLYTTRNGRWLSPKLIAGESYGTMRAVALAEHLHGAYGMEVNAIVLISAVLNLQTISFTMGNDVPCIAFLPSYALTAAYHKKSPYGTKEQVRPPMADVEQWALNEYTTALAKGDALKKDERERIVEKLTAYTGLPRESIRNGNLRIPVSQFLRTLLRDDNLTVGLLDSRFAAVGRFEDLFSNDPSFYGTLGAYVAGINDYLRNDLRYTNDLPYEYLSRRVNASWNWGSAAQGFPNVSDTLQEMMRRSGALKVFIASGYYDLDTPYFGVIYDINHLGLEPELRKNITVAFYKAGHQPYTDMPSLKKLREDIGKFFNSLRY
ncbi:MAG TPA: hypothetical protein VF790_11770 [Dissulfurispiraceae bacterium]